MSTGSPTAMPLPPYKKPNRAADWVRKLPGLVHTWARPGNTWKFCQHWFGLFSALLLIYSLQYARHEFAGNFDEHDPVKVQQAIMLAFWIVVPPVWFWFEYFYLYKGSSNDDLEKFKHGQDQSSKIWLALVTVLLAAYFGKDLIRDVSPEPSKAPQASASPQNSQAPQPTPVVTTHGAKPPAGKHHPH